MRRIALLASVAILCGPTVALARSPAGRPPVQAAETAPAATPGGCADGKVATPDGRCCWAGQSWSSTWSLCLGAPRCPVGLVAQGANCVPPNPVPSAPTLPAQQARPAPPAYVPPPGYVYPFHPRLPPRRFHGGRVPPGAHVTLRPNSVLVKAGIGLLASFYGLALATGAWGAIEAAQDDVVYDVDSHNTHVEAQLAYNLIPIVGPLVAGARFQAEQDRKLWFDYPTGGTSPGLVWVGEAIDCAGQVGGLALLIAGAVTHQKWLVFAEADRAEVALLPNGAGASLFGRF